MTCHITTKNWSSCSITPNSYQSVSNGSQSHLYNIIRNPGQKPYILHAFRYGAPARTPPSVRKNDSMDMVYARNPQTKPKPERKL